MSKSSTIGSLLLKIGAQIDKNSFETGNKLVDGVANSFNKLIGSARNASLVLGTTAIATGVLESKAYKTSEAIGVSTEILDLWKASAKIAGLSADSLVSSMAKVSDVMANEKWDTGKLVAFEKELDKLGMSYSELRDLSPDKAVEKIMDRAQELLAGGAGMSEMYAIINSVLGGGAADLLTELNRRGLTMADLLQGAQKTVFTDSRTNQNAQNFNVEVQTLKAELQSIGSLVGSEFGKVLTPLFSDLNKWIQDNSETIKSAIENIAKFVEKIVNSDFMKDTGKTVTAALKLIGGDKKGALDELKKTSAYQNAVTVGSLNQMVKDYAAANGIKDGWKLKFDEVPEYIQQAILDYYANGGNKTWSPIDYNSTKSAAKNYGVMNDGIMRPDGTVTQVAPDDWVFAARNLGDLARAFVPQNHTSVSGGEYIINQTFNINGGNDMPQVLRQQAYKGTQEGLLEMMTESTRRLQLMSGTR